MAKVFISYQRKPSAVLANRIHDVLERQGISTFLDVSDMREAVPFPETLVDQIQASIVFICLLADTTLQSTWVNSEIVHAHTMGKVLIPVFQETFVPPQQQNEDIRALINTNGIPIIDKRGLYIEEALNNLTKMVRKSLINQFNDDYYEFSSRYREFIRGGTSYPYRSRLSYLLIFAIIIGICGGFLVLAPIYTSNIILAVGRVLSLVIIPATAIGFINNWPEIGIEKAYAEKGQLLTGEVIQSVKTEEHAGNHTVYKITTSFRFISPTDTPLVGDIVQKFSRPLNRLPAEGRSVKIIYLDERRFKAL